MTTETITPADTVEEKALALAQLITGEESKAAELKAEAAKHTSVADGYKAELRQLLDLGTHTIGNVKITISKPSRSFDAEAFLKAYPIELNPALYKPVIDTAALPPKLKDQFMVTGNGEPKVTVK